MDGHDPYGPTGDAALSPASQDETLLSLTPAASIGARTGHEPEISLSGENVRALMAPKYTTTKVLGRGGMGEVALGLDRDLRREVAVKTLLRLDDSRAMARFIEEAQVTGQLEHPNIVPVHELGMDAAKHPFLVMKRVKGRDLATVLDALRAGLPTGLVVTPVPVSAANAPSVDPNAETMTDVRSHRSSRRTRVSSARMRAAARVSGQTVAATLKPSKDESPSQALARLLEVFAKTCDAVAYAHSRGVIHRDLKPENIMVGEFGEVLVMDWGLSKAIGRPDTHQDRLVVTGRTDDPNAMRTADGAVAGTPMYMSPEQARGEIDALDERSDIYALGVILYEMLSLARPYDADTVYALLGQVARGLAKPMRPRSQATWSIPRELEAITYKAMSLHPRNRYATVLELKADLVAWQANMPISARRDGPVAGVTKWVKRHPTIALSSAVAVLFSALLAVVMAIAIANGEATEARLAREETARLNAEAARVQAEHEAEKQRDLALLEAGRADEVIERYGGVVRRKFDEKVQEWQRLWNARQPEFATIMDFTDWLGGSVYTYLDAFEQLFQYSEQYPDRLQPTGDDHFFRGLLRDITGNREGAVEDYSAAIALEPDYAQAFYNRAIMRDEDGDADGAIADYNEAIRIWPDYAVALCNRGILLFEARHDHAGALRDFSRALEARPDLNEAYHARGRLYLSQGNLDAAIKEFDAALVIAPDDPNVYMDRGAILLDRGGNGDVQAALRDFDRLIELDPGRAEGYHNRGTAAWRLGDRAEAIEFYTKAIERDPGMTLSYYSRAVLHLALGNNEAAIADYTVVVDRSPDDPRSYHGRGRAHFFMNHMDDALADFTAAIRADQTFVRAYEDRGTIYEQLGNDTEALADWEKAVAVDPNAWNAWRCIGRMSAERGDRDHAAEAFDRAAACVPERYRHVVETTRSEALGD